MSVVVTQLVIRSRLAKYAEKNHEGNLEIVREVSSGIGRSSCVTEIRNCTARTGSAVHG